MNKLDYIPKTNIKMIHIPKSYSFGIDSIILLNFAKMKKNKTLIDIGAGIDNIEVINKNLNNVDFPINSTDYIITNPPYYKITDNISNTSEEFLISRQEKYLNLDDIFTFANKTLKDKGKLFMIHKPNRMVEIFTKSANLKAKRLRFVSSKATTKPEFMLIEFVKNAKDGLKIEYPLIIYENGKYSKEMNEISGRI